MRIYKVTVQYNVIRREYLFARYTNATFSVYQSFDVAESRWEPENKLTNGSKQFCSIDKKRWVSIEVIWVENCSLILRENV